MNRLARGDVVRTLFLKGQAGQALVIRADRYIGSENVTLCPVTSTLAGGPLRVRVMPGQSGLERESEVVPYRIITLPGRRVGAPIGQLSSTEMRELNAVLRDWLNLDERMCMTSTQ